MDWVDELPYPIYVQDTSATSPSPVEGEQCGPWLQVVIISCDICLTQVVHAVSSIPLAGAGIDQYMQSNPSANES